MNMTSLRRFITKYEMAWHLATLSFFGVALVLVVFLFPNVSNTWISVFVLIGSFTTAVTAMIAALKTRGER